MSRANRQKETRPDYSGSFELETIPTGDALVEVADQASGFIASERVEVRSSQVSYVELHLSAGATLSGSVRVFDGPGSLEGLPVLLQSEDLVLRHSTIDLAGDFRFESLRPGKYRVLVSGLETSTSLTNKENAHLDFRPTARTVTCATSASTSSFSTRNAAFLRSSQGSWATEIVAYSEKLRGFRFPRVVDGTYELVVLSEDGIPSSSRLVIVKADSLCRLD